MAEEFQESDIVFTAEDGDGYLITGYVDSDSEEQSRRCSKRKKVEKKTTKKKKTSENIPVSLTLFRNRNVRCMKPSLYEYEYEYEEEEEHGEIVPPHVVVRRRLAEKMAFSVCYGMGRTLKGRDLSEMRNCVLRMTGFLES